MKNYNHLTIIDESSVLPRKAFVQSVQCNHALITNSISIDQLSPSNTVADTFSLRHNDPESYASSLGLKQGFSRGFTLIEVMISIVVAMVVLAGLLLTFTKQSGEYSYQNKRIDTIQDLEFGLNTVAEDLRSALVVNGAVAAVIVDALGVADPYTEVITFTVWKADAPALDTSKRFTMNYQYNRTKKRLNIDRDTSTISADEVLPHVTNFKVFEDGVTPRAGYTNIPGPLPMAIPMNGPTAGVTTNGYTIMIELEVDAGYRGGSLVDVHGTVVTSKRVWRYMQVYPVTAVN